MAPEIALLRAQGLVFKTNFGRRPQVNQRTSWGQKTVHAIPRVVPRYQNLRDTVLRASNRARCRRCRSVLVSHWIISICRPIGGHITLSTYSYNTSPLLETFSTEQLKNPPEPLVLKVQPVKNLRKSCAF